MPSKTASKLEVLLFYLVWINRKETLPAKRPGWKHGLCPLSLAGQEEYTAAPPRDCEAPPSKGGEQNAAQRTEGLGLSLLREHWARSWTGKNWVPEILGSQVDPLIPQTANLWEEEGVPNPHLQDCKLHRTVRPDSKTFAKGSLYELLSDTMLAFP